MRSGIACAVLENHCVWSLCSRNSAYCPRGAVLGCCCVTAALWEHFRLKPGELFFSTAEKDHSKRQNLIAYCAWVRKLCRIRSAFLRNPHQLFPRTNFFTLELEEFSISAMCRTDSVEANKLCSYLE